MSESDREQLALQVRVMQIIVLALAMGVATFAVVVLLVIRPEPTEDDVLLGYIAVAAALLAVPIGLVVPRMIASRQSASLATYQTKLIVGAAIFEGAAFFNLVAYMIEGQTFNLATAAVLVVFILLQFPSVGGVQDWLDQRDRRRHEQESFGQ